MTELVAQVTSCHGTTLKFTELLRVIGTPVSDDLEGCVNTFGNVV